MTVAGRLSAFSIQRSTTNELRETYSVPGGDAVAQYHAELLQRAIELKGMLTALLQKLI
jgi:hypothetical protein